MGEDQAEARYEEPAEPDAPPDPARFRVLRRPDKSTVALGAVLAFLLVVVLFNIYLTLTRTSAECNFNKDLAGLPVTIAAGTNRPTQLGMAIIAHTREAYRGLGCSGPLPPPSPSFVHWAPFFHLSPE